MPIELFTVDDGVHGRELWRTDGTATGTFLVKDILPGSVGSGLGSLTKVGSQVFFTASDKQFGPVQLWVNDGTAAGTVKVSETISGAANFVDYNGFLHFIGSDRFANHGVFRTDGTAAGTVLVSASTFDFYTPTVSNGLIYFVGDSSFVQQEPWVSDGTAAGTHLLKDIYPKGNSLSPFSTNFTPVGSLTFFTANEPTHGSELWVTDGTTSGTTLVQDINPGTSDSDPTNFIAAGSRLVFTANGGQLYGSDGTAAGTVALPIAKGTPGGIVGLPVANTVANLFQLDAATVTFFGTDGSHPFGLFRTDGTAAGTSFIAAINNDGYKPALLNGFEYVYGSDGVQSGLFRTDGTAGGTSFVAATGSFYNATVSNGRIFFTGSDAQGSELWVTDGTAPGTGRVTDIVPGSGSSSPSLLSAYGNGVIFTATEPVHGTEVYFSDGTTTTRASDIAMPAGSGITLFIPLDGVPRLTFTTQLQSGTAPEHVTFSGTLHNPDPTTVQVFDHGTLLGTATVDAALGTWSLDATLAPGAHYGFTAVATDSDGDTANAALTGPFAVSYTIGVTGAPFTAQTNYVDAAGHLVTSVYLMGDGRLYQLLSYGYDGAGQLGFTNTTYADGTVSSLVPVSGNPNFASSYQLFDSSGHTIAQTYSRVDGTKYQTVVNLGGGTSVKQTYDTSEQVLSKQIDRPDGTHEISQFRVTGQDYVSSDILYDSGYHPLVGQYDHADGSHLIQASVAGQHLFATRDADVLGGVAGRDIFVFHAGFGSDRLGNFEVGTDVVQLSGVTDAAGLQAVLNAAHDDAGGNAVLSFTGQDTLTFTGVHAATLQQHPGDFLLA
ncbi:MAG: ELWxxDGT repeat protein [Microvirga sp.]